MGETCPCSFHSSGWLWASVLTCRFISLVGVKWSCLRINKQAFPSGHWILSRRKATHALAGGRKVDVRPPGKGNSNSHGARPACLIITMIKWIRTSRLSIKSSLWFYLTQCIYPTVSLNSTPPKQHQLHLKTRNSGWKPKVFSIVPGL